MVVRTRRHGRRRWWGRSIRVRWCWAGAWIRTRTSAGATSSWVGVAGVALPGIARSRAITTTRAARALRTGIGTAPVVKRFTAVAQIHRVDHFDHAVLNRTLVAHTRALTGVFRRSGGHFPAIARAGASFGAFVFLALAIDAGLTCRTRRFLHAHAIHAHLIWRTGLDHARLSGVVPHGPGLTIWRQVGTLSVQLTHASGALARVVTASVLGQSGVCWTCISEGGRAGHTAARATAQHGADNQIAVFRHDGTIGIRAARNMTGIAGIPG